MDWAKSGGGGDKLHRRIQKKVLSGFIQFRFRFQKFTNPCILCFLLLEYHTNIRNMIILKIGIDFCSKMHEYYIIMHTPTYYHFI